MQNITEGYVHVQSTYKLCIASAAVNENLCMWQFHTTDHMHFARAAVSTFIEKCDDWIYNFT